MMAFPEDDPTVLQGDPTLRLIDWLVERLQECDGEALPLMTDDFLKDRVKVARNSIASAIEELGRVRAEREKQLKSSHPL